MTPAERLADAEKQLHLLVTGQAATVMVDQNGERVEFRPADSRRLAAYIGELRRQIAGQTRPATLPTKSSKGLT
jgi:hypothetical protein